MSSLQPETTKVQLGAKIWAGFSLFYLLFVLYLLGIGISRKIDFLPRHSTPSTILEIIYYILPIGVFFTLLAMIPYNILWRKDLKKSHKCCFLLFLLHLYALLFEIHILNWNLLVFGIPYFIGLWCSLFLLREPKRL